MAQAPNVNANSPTFQNAAYTQMLGHWDFVEDLRGGTSELRKLGKKYLPKHPLESNRSYENRVATSVFYNAFEHTLKGLAGMIFRKDPVVSEDCDVEIRGDAENGIPGLVNNIDNQGTHLDVFLREAAEVALRYGHVYIHVDMPPVMTQGSNPDGSANLEDYRKAGMRPYLTYYTPKQALNWRTEIRNGALHLTQITFEETALVPDGDYGEKAVKRYRVLRRGEWQTFLFDKQAPQGSQIVAENSGTVPSFPHSIPLICIYANKCAPFISHPPLVDLGHLNVSHWQLGSDYRHILHVANVPVLCRSGYNATTRNGAAENFGPNRIIDVAQGGDVWWAEHHGYAIGHARTEILDLEQRMSVLGLSLLARKTDASAVTATEKRIDSAEQSSSLGLFARNLQDGVKQAFEYLAIYLGKPAEKGGSVTINNSFDDLSLDPQKLGQYSKMVSEGQLSIETLWQMMQMYGELPENFDPETEMDRIVTAAELNADGMTDGEEDGDDLSDDKKTAGAKDGAGQKTAEEDVPAEREKRRTSRTRGRGKTGTKASRNGQPA